MQRRRSDGTVEYAAVKALRIPMEEDETRTLVARGYSQDYIREKYRRDADDLKKEFVFMEALKDNPNVVHCDDLMVVPSPDDDLGCCLLIKMELLTPMEEVMRPVYDEQQVISLGMDICNALAACKKHKILHRDIKPQNIMVSNDGTYKLGDFGVSKTLEHTATGTRIGTWAFMAPEVFAHQKYNNIADIYSLGIVLYWMMNNRREPFLPQSDMPPSNSERQTARERRFDGEMLPYPANGSLALQNAVLRACDPDPKKRFDSPEEMYNTLAALQVSQDKFSSGSYHYSYSTGRKKKNSQSQQTMPDSGQGGSSGGSSSFSGGSYHYSYSGGRKNAQTQQTTPGGGTMGNNWGGEGNGSVGPNDRSGPNSGGTMGPDDKKPHGNNVYTSLDVKVSLKLKKSEAASGCQKNVTIRGGRNVKVTIPAGSDKADTLRLPGLGLEDPATGAKGTLYVKLVIEDDFWGEDTDTNGEPVYLSPKDDERVQAILRTYQPTHQLIKVMIPAHTAQKANPVDVTGFIVNAEGKVVDASAAPIPLKINTVLVNGTPTDIQKMPYSILRQRMIAAVPPKKGFLYYVCRIMVWFGVLAAVECLFTGLIPQALVFGVVAVVGIAGSSSPDAKQQAAGSEAKAELERRRKLEVH